MKTTKSKHRWLGLVLGCLLLPILADAAVAKSCATIKIKRAPETAPAGEIMVAVGVIANKCRKPHYQIVWALVDEAGDRTPLRRSPVRVEKGTRTRFKHRMLVPEDVAPGTYALAVFAKRRGKVIARDAVAIDILEPLPEDP